MSAQFLKKLIHRLAILFISVGLIACASTAPVQEMSNARQTIAAAHEARASEFAAEQINEAERLMQEATQALETGDYISARQFAVEAQQQAIKARQAAVSAQQK